MSLDIVCVLLLFDLVPCCVQYLDIKTSEGIEKISTSAIFHSSVGIKTFKCHIVLVHKSHVLFFGQSHIGLIIVPLLVIIFVVSG